MRHPAVLALALLIGGVSTDPPSPLWAAQTGESRRSDPGLEEANRLIEQARKSGAQQAIPLYEKALALLERSVGPEHSALAQIVYGLGAAHYEIGDYARALSYFQRSLAIDEKTLGPDHADIAADLNNVAGLYRDLGEYAKALPLYQRGLAILEKVFGPEHPNVAVGLNNLAVLYRDMGEYAKALPLYQRSLTIREKTLDAGHPGVATSLNNLAALYQAMGDYANALPLYRQSLAAREKALGPEHPDVAISLNNLASLYRAMGEYAKALPLYQRSLAVVGKALGSEHPDMAMSLNNLASLYRDMGEYAKAAPLYQRSLAIVEKALGAGHPSVAISLNNMALLYRDTGEYAKAVPLYQRSLAIWEKTLGAGHPSVAISRNNLAGLYRDMGDYANALPLYQQSLAARETALGPAHLDVAVSLNNLAALYENIGAYEKALPLYQRALPIASIKTAPELLWRVQVGLRILLARQQQPALAIFFGKQAVNTIQSLRGQLAGLERELQRSFLENKTDAYRGLADLLIEQGRLAEAQQVLGMLKEEEFFEFIRRSEADDPRNRRIEFLAHEQPWHERLQQLIAEMGRIGAEQAELDRRARLGLEENEKRRLAALSAENAAAAAELERFYRDINEAFAGLRPDAEGAEAIANLASLQRTLAALGPGTVVVHYVQAGKRLSIILTSATRQVARRAPIESAELNNRIEFFRVALRNPAIDPRPMGQELYKLLISPIAGDLAQAKASTVMLALDGTLRYIPFAALHDGNQYLVERYGLAMFTEVAREQLSHRPSERHSIAGLGLTRAIEDFQPLPAVKAELEAIVKHGNGGLLPGELHLDQEFDLAHIRRALAGGYPMLHIASHFVFRPGTEANSFLLLGDGERLTLGRIKADHLDFSHLDLITLSACETGLGGGRNAQGEEIEGLGALAQKQGAKGVIATLWPVADESTGLLMQQFYRRRHTARLTKAEALQQAQLAFIRGQQPAVAAVDPGGKPKLSESQAESASRYAHPFYWAPFILMGNWL